jgi:hypothetical protein
VGGLYIASVSSQKIIAQQVVGNNVHELTDPGRSGVCVGRAQERNRVHEVSGRREFLAEVEAPPRARATAWTGGYPPGTKVCGVPVFLLSSKRCVERF